MQRRNAQLPIAQTNEMNRERQPRLHGQNRAKLVARGAFLDFVALIIRRGNRAGHVQELLRGAVETRIQEHRALTLDHIQIALTTFAGAEFAPLRIAGGRCLFGVLSWRGRIHHGHVRVFLRVL